MRKSLFISVLLIAVALVAFSGCGDKKRASLQDAAVLPDKTLYENGMHYLNKNQFIKARLSFQTLINAYEESPYLEKAKYHIAYSFLREGGIDNWLQGEQAFRDFRLFFPTSEMADKAQAHIVEINMRMMHAPSRDLKYTQKAEAEVLRFLLDFPQSPIAPEMELRRMYIQDVIATSYLLKGQFYHKRRQYKAATARLRESVTKYRNFGRRDLALFLLGESLDHLKNYDDSATYYAQIAQGYPFSKYFQKAKERLKTLEKPVPEVDSKLAEENKKTYYEDESILKSPFKSVFGVVGLGGEDAPWETMGKQREAQEREQVKAASGSGGKAENSKSKQKGKKGKNES